MPASPQTEQALAEIDGDLVARARSGDREAFDVLVGRHLSLVYAVALAHLRDRDAADDLVQETFLRAYLALDGLAQPERFGPWVARIARNLSLNWLRDRRRRSLALPLVALDERAGEVPDPRENGAREQLAAEEEGRALAAAVAKLGAEEREVVLLHYGHDLSAPEIAERLGLHRATVRRRLDRAVAILRTRLDPSLRAAVGAMQPGTSLGVRAGVVVAAAALLTSEAKAAIASEAGATAAVAAATQSLTAATGSLAVQAVATALALLALLSAGLWWHGWQPRTHTSTGLTAESLTIVDAEGRPRARLDTAGLRLLDAGGGERLGLRLEADGAAALAVRDADGNERVALGTGSGGEAGLALKSVAGSDRLGLRLEADGGVALSLNDAEGREALAMSLSARGDACGLGIRNAAGQRRFHFGTDPQGGVGMDFRDATGRPHLVLRSRSGNQPEIVLSDEDAVPRLSLRADSAGSSLTATARGGQPLFGVVAPTAGRPTVFLNGTQGKRVWSAPRAGTP